MHEMLLGRPMRITVIWWRRITTPMWFEDAVNIQQLSAPSRGPSSPKILGIGSQVTCYAVHPGIVHCILFIYVHFNKYAKMINNMAYVEKTFRRNPQKNGISFQRNGIRIWWCHTGESLFHFLRISSERFFQYMPCYWSFLHINYLTSWQKIPSNISNTVDFRIRRFRPNMT